MHSINRYEVVAMSEEFLAFAKRYPEFSDVPFVEIGGKVIEGPTRVLVVSSRAEVELNLPAIMANLGDPARHQLWVTHKVGICISCKDHAGEVLTSCPNLARTPLHSVSWNIEVPEHLSPLRLN